MRYCSKTRAIASGQDKTCRPSCQIGWGAANSFKLFDNLRRFNTGAQRERDQPSGGLRESTRTATRLANRGKTSQMPSSSSLIVTYKEPQPVLIRTVSPPLVTVGRFLGECDFPLPSPFRLCVPNCKHFPPFSRAGAVDGNSLAAQFVG